MIRNVNRQIQRQKADWWLPGAGEWEVTEELRFLFK